MVEQKAIPAEAATQLLKDGEFTEAAFRAMATIPMEWMEVGVVRQELPYDFDELLRLCAA